MPSVSRKKHAATALTARIITRAVKRLRLKSLLPSVREEAILVASTKSRYFLVKSILIDSEDESMDSGSDYDYLPGPTQALKRATKVPK